MSNCKVLVCCHKDDIHCTEEPYLPIHVGKELSNSVLSILTDNSGDNISAKNQSYCELTGMYWAWKNLKGVDVIGLCHYRRYFDFHHQCQHFFPVTPFPTASFGEIDLSIPSSIIQRVTEGAIIAPAPKSYPHNLWVDYCGCHNSQDYRVLRDVIYGQEDQSYIEAFDTIMTRNHRLRHYNMFLMKWSDFDAYCEWLFHILSIVESKTDISGYDSVQRRIYGYMAERLMNVWLLANRKEVLEKKIIWFTDDDHKHPAWHEALRMIRDDLGTWILSLWNK